MLSPERELRPTGLEQSPAKFPVLDLLEEGRNFLKIEGMQAGKNPQDPSREIYERGQRAFEAGDFKAAEKFFKTGLEAATTRLGLQSTDVGVLSNAAGLSCERDRRWGDARKYYETALASSKAASKNEDNPLTASNLSNLARMDARQGKLEAADKGFIEAERMFEQFNPRDLPKRVADSLMAAYIEHYHLLSVRGEPEAAAAVLRRAQIAKRFLEQAPPQEKGRPEA